MAAVRSGGKTPEMDTHLSAGPGDPIKAAVIGGFCAACGTGSGLCRRLCKLTEMM